MDGRFSDRNVGQLLSDDMGRVSHGYVLTIFERPAFAARLCNFRMTLGWKIFIDDLITDTALGRTTLPGRVLGTNRRDSDDSGHLRYHWVSRYGCGFLECGRGVLTRSVACRTFVLGSGNSNRHRIGAD